MRWLFTLLVAGVFGTFAAAWADPLEIAPPSDALTFARSYEDGMPSKLLLVIRYEGETITGIDMSHALGRPVYDPIILYQELGRPAILEALKVIPESAAVTVPIFSLGMPVGLGGNHIAAGANFSEHADEAEVEEGPFLFPKQVQPTPWNAPIPIGEGLLDYEVELCFVPMRDFPPVRPSSVMGLILCNDVTDRALLLKRIDAFDIGSGKGFTEGKSAPGYLPVGNLFVIPADMDAFTRTLVLHLSVNGEARQLASVSRMVWNLREILLQTEARKDHRWAFHETWASLPISKGRVPARAMIMSGTPSGTVFDGVRTMHKVRGFLDYLLGGWDQPMQQWVMGRYTREERKLDRYLKAGDTVHIRVDRMGELLNPVEKPVE
ncbi:fumarylacetoacetate hydrolase family protein [Kordiimonas lacus]|uniref:2-keto-4-pentenoate hydratase/2-oxohepta-3-ene-1,7-dioic acid hydratase (Catechol pathway) n=1 Tax=Kordiimonas lacus TaxID=637679 RepID=A0A1G6YCX7_9PROT|nr:fumarylacetoacetate hydrolase family protein [Kordiimonas lacus]SDD88182.1 2-keto-4-pentenoate hydratase/2-oxohepta-3-ene-1,7-dioic acid hydratase (catechol pathway) [Kordiimonas lacus]